MPAAQYPLTIEQGADFQRTIQLFDGSENVIPVSGWTAKLQVRSDASDATVLLEISTSNGRITILNDQFVLVVPTSVINALTAWDEAVYDMFVTDTSSESYPILYGSCDFRQRVTQ